MRFVGRAAELATLERLYRQAGFRLVALHGRRRLGKTRLLREFLARKAALYYLASPLPGRAQLAALRQATRDQLGLECDDASPADAGLTAAFGQLFELLASYSRRQRLVLVLDEYPLLAAAAPELADGLWRCIARLAGANLLVILSGSSAPAMRRELLGAQAPLRSLLADELELGELDLRALRSLLPELTSVQLVETVAIFGAVPAYLERLVPGRDLLATIEAAALAPGAPLRDEVELLLRAELREPRTYLAVLAAIAAGQHRLGAIAQAAGLPRGHAARYLDSLRDLGLVERHVPITQPDWPGDPPGRSGRYALRDRFMAFWLRWILPAASLIEAGAHALLYERLRAGLHQHVAAAYAQLCQEVCRQLMAGGVLRFDRIGRWWGAAAERPIDLVAYDEIDQIAYFGACRWSVDPLREEAYLALRRAAMLAAWSPRSARPLSRRFVLFSRSGFTAALSARAAAEGVLLVEGLDLPD